MSSDGEAPVADATVRKPYGTAPVGPFDYCPKLGFRECMAGLIERPDSLPPAGS